MTPQEKFSYTENSDVQELAPFGATMEDTLPSFSSILGAGNDDNVESLTPALLAKKLSGINEFYDGLKGPYFSAQGLMRKNLSEKKAQLQTLTSKKDRKAVQSEIEELEDGLSWSIKKLNVLEAERVALISKLR